MVRLLKQPSTHARSDFNRARVSARLSDSAPSIVLVAVKSAEWCEQVQILKLIRQWKPMTSSLTMSESMAASSKASS